MLINLISAVYFLHKSEICEFELTRKCLKIIQKMTESPIVVKNLDNLLKGCLKSSEKVVGTKVSRLTAPGENYGSIMLRILIKVEDSKTETERTLDTVAKLVSDNEIALQIFNPSVSYRNEYKYYALIVPILDKFLKGKGFPEGADFAVPFYGGRLNLDDGERVVNDEAIILMQNLKLQGYVTGIKSTGLDIDSLKTALDALAKFHASGMALRLQEPETFENNFRPYFFSFLPATYLYQAVYTNLIHTLENNGFSKEEVERVKKLYQSDQYKKNISDQWGTMIHYDSWINNVLLKYQGSKPIHCVLVDFQMFDFGTPQNDIMFFLLTSIQQDNFEESLDILLKYYYDKLIINLNKMDVDTRLFTKASFDAEVTKAVKNYEYVHTMWMLETNMDKEFTSLDHFTSDNVGSLLNWSDEHVYKIKYITRLCFDRGWL